MEDGRYVGRATRGVLGFTSTGKEQIAVGLVVTQGDFAGCRITWYGYFTDATRDRTFAALRAMGWAGDDLTDLAGLDANEVSFTVKSEEYNGQLQQKVAWINPLDEVFVKDAMNAQQAKAFAQSMKGAAIASRGGNAPAAGKPRNKTKANPPPDNARMPDNQYDPDADIPF